MAVSLSSSGDDDGVLTLGVVVPRVLVGGPGVLFVMINVTEDRAVLHVALRAPLDAEIVVDGRNVAPDVYAVLDRMARFANRVRTGAWRPTVRSVTRFLE
jgi:hypothetical protein